MSHEGSTGGPGSGRMALHHSGLRCWLRSSFLRMVKEGVPEPLRARRIAFGVGVLLSVVSVLTALFLHQHFVDSLAGQLRQLKVTVDAPGARTIRVYWDDPTVYPQAYAAFPVVEGGVQETWNVRLEALRERNPAAQDNELWVFSIRTPEQAVTWKDISLLGDWSLLAATQLRGMKGNIGGITGAVPNSLSVTLKGSWLSILVGRSAFSGKLKMTVNGLTQIVDLYSAHWNIRELTFFAKAPVDYGPRTHDVLIKRGQGRWNKLNFVADAGRSLDIQGVSVDGVEPSRINRDTFELVKPRWPAYRLAGGVTLTALVLLVSTTWLGSLLWVTGDQTQLRVARRYEYLAVTSFAALMAFVLTILFYPGIINEDAMARWKLAMEVLDKGAPLSRVDTCFPPLMTLAMMVTHTISREFGLATFLQAFFFYYCLGLLSIDLFGRRLAIIFTPLLALIPTRRIAALALSPDTGTAIGLMACAILIHRRRERRDLKGEMGSLLLFLLSCILLFGLRYNSMAVLPFLIAAIWILFRSRPMRVAYVAVALLAAALVHKIPAMIGAGVHPVSAPVLLWEHIGMLKELNDEGVTQRHRLESIDDTLRAIRIHHHMAPDNLIYGGNAPFPVWSVVENGEEVKAAFWRLAREHPWAFLANRTGIYAWLLGIPGHPYRLHWLDSDWESVFRDNIAETKLYGFYYIRDEGSLAMRIEEWNASFVNLPIVRLFFYPWFLLTVLVLLGGIVLYLRLPVVIIALVAGLAVAYYATFFILGSGAAFRYYFPSYVLLQLAVIACVSNLARLGTGSRRAASRAAGVSRHTFPV